MYDGYAHAVVDHELFKILAALKLLRQQDPRAYQAVLHLLAALTATVRPVLRE
jgi:hypothetical protein